MRMLTRPVCALSAYMALATAVHAEPTPGLTGEKDFNISAQSLSKAVVQFSDQSGIQVVTAGAEVAKFKTEGFKGHFAISQALKTLLSGTHLSYQVVGESTVALVAPLSRTDTTDDQGIKMAEARNAAGANANEAAENSPTSTSTGPTDEIDRRATLAEVIVTAQKRSERLLDVPTAISAVSGERLEALQVNSISDLADYVPGVSVVSGGAPGSRTIVIRGLNTSYSQSTQSSMVATYIDDLPVGSSSAATRGGQYGLDLIPYDIAAIEILKGPQGTLYGANTMGGLIKYSLRKPDLGHFEARVGGDVESIDGSGKMSWAGQAAINLPIVTDTLAVRLSGFHKNNAGYIDNAITGSKNVNHSAESGGRLTLLWQPMDRLNVQATYLTQNVDVANLTEVTLNGATLQPLYGHQLTDTLFPEPTRQTTRNFSLSIDWKLDFATLTSSSGYSRINNTLGWDLTNPFGQYVALVDPTQTNALALFDLSDFTSKFVEELRLTSRNDQRLQWLLGAYYTKEHAEERQDFPTFSSTYAALPAADNLLITATTNVYEEVAGFANLTYQITDRLDISGGERYTRYKQQSCPFLSAGIFGSGSQPCSELPSTGVSVWMTNARFHLDHDSMLYARIATGYRPGSGCPTCGKPLLGIPGIVRPDSTTNYEVGFKSQLFDQRLQLDASAFYIKWKDIQLKELTPQGFGYSDNGGTAGSRGIELAASYQIIDDLRINSTLAYTDAHLTQDAPRAGGKNGDQLPNSPRWTGSLTADYTRPLDQSKTLLLGGGYRYRDAVVNQFANSGDPAPNGPQNLVDLYTGLTIDKAMLRLYGTNVFNNRSYSGLLLIEDPARQRFIPVQPRTLGISVDYQF